MLKPLFRKKRVLIFSPDSIEKPMGGLGVVLGEYCNFFDKKKFEIFIIGPNTQQEGIYNNCRYYPISNIFSSNGIVDGFSSVFLMQSLYIEKANNLPKPDIIHCLDWSTSFAGRILSKKYKIPLFFSIHLSVYGSIKNPHENQRRAWEIACGLEIAAMNDAKIISHVSYSYAIKNTPGYFLNKTTITPNGINLQKFENGKKIELPGHRKIKLVYIGRFVENKNIQTLLNCNFPKEIDLIIIGDTNGSDKDIFNYMLEKTKKNDNFYYVGPKYGQEKIDFLKSADAVIIPSTHEPFGMVAIESLASECILLSSFVDGMGDLLNNNCAINCGITKESIEESFTKLVNLKEEEKEELIKNGLEVCKKNSWEKNIKHIEWVYENINKEIK